MRRSSLSALWRLQRESGRLSEAEDTYRRAMDIMVRKNGPNHLDLAGVLGDLGVIRLREGRHREAQDFFQRALSIQEQNLGLKHPDIAITLNNLASCAL